MTSTEENTTCFPPRGFQAALAVVALPTGLLISHDSPDFVQLYYFEYRRFININLMELNIFIQIYLKIRANHLLILYSTHIFIIYYYIYYTSMLTFLNVYF